MLDCVLEAVNPDVETLTQEARLKYLSDTRKEMARYAYLAKQNMWDVSDYEIIGRLENLETYLDPRKWIILIEKVFKINVYVFARDNDSEDVYLVVPDHKNGLYTNIKKYDKSVVIYEHYGNESDNAKYPQCEIVCRWDTNNQNIAIPYLSGNILDGYINTVFRQTSHTTVDFPIEKQVKAQGIDYSGKTRYVEIDGVVFFTTPLYNLTCNKQISIPSTVPRYRYGDVKSLCDKYGISIIGKSGDNSELNCRVGNVEMWVSITPTRLDVSTYPTPQFKTLQKDVYSHNQSIARILIENAIYSYSCYIQKAELDPRDLKNIAKFAKRYIQVDEKHEYPDKIDLSLSRSNSYMKDFIVKVKNLETAKRLVYHIRLALESNLQRVIEMYKSSRINNFYRDIHDMDIRSQELVVKGSDMIKRMANTVISNRVYTEIRFDINKYLCTIIEPKRIYQVIGSETTLEKLFKRVYDLDTVPEFILYACHSSTTTKKYHVTGDRYDQVYRVLGWRVSATEVRYAILKQD